MVEYRNDEAERVTVERKGAGMARVTLRKSAGTREAIGEGETEKVQHVYDVQAYETPYDEGLQARVEADFEKEFARAYDRETMELAEEARAERDARLTACDYRVAVDYPADDAERDAWITYRQALRDVPEQTGFPRVITWPDAPGRVKAEDTLMMALDAAFGE